MKKKTYTYDGQAYTSHWDVREAIEKKENWRFGPEPEEGKAEFWASKGVTYEETEVTPTADDVRPAKLAALERAFRQWYEEDATVTSSLGFVADSDSRAVTDVTGLITVSASTPEESRTTVAFMDHDNTPHQLTLESLQTLQLEIIQNGQAAYQQKWTMRTAIESAQTAEEVQGVKIEFTGLDFSQEAA